MRPPTPQPAARLALPFRLVFALLLAEAAVWNAAGTVSLSAQEPAAAAGARGATDEVRVGPPSGSLVVVGGALRDPAIVQRFLELAGGPDAPIVVIPTAGGAEAYGADYGGLEAFRRVGATDLTVLHTTDPAEADTDAFAAPLRRAAGVWFPGGRQWRLADAYLGTRTEQALRDVLERGGVVGGTSAGATILGSYLVRGDTRTNTVMMGDHVEGFGFLRGTAIDQHLLARNRHFDLLEVIEARPDLLGIGIDENTAIVVRGDTFDVIGDGYVAIYDAGATLDGLGPFYFLSPGDRFDLATRTPYRVGSDGEARPLDRVVRSGG